MGSKLHVLAQVIVLALATATAGAQPAAELLKKAGEEYKAGKYEAAAALLQKAYELEPKPETLFALAQAERLAGKCAAAVPHYKKLITELKDLDIAKLVQSNLSLCQKDEPVVEPKPTPVQPAPAPIVPPKERIVVRVEQRSDKLALTSFAAGTLALGAAVGFYISANGNRDAAVDARTLEDSRRFNDRADGQRAVSIVAGLAGAGLVSYAIVRWLKKPETSAPTVTIVPGSATFGYVARF
jgi:tetratricopeptide (TPR) repeat protein